MRARWPSLTPISYLPQSRPASGGLSRKLLLRFRLRASDFLSRQKVTKDRLKDPWSLRISFPSNPAPCLPLNSALREPTRPGPARCRPWAIEGPPAPDGKAPCVGSRRSVDRHPPTPSAPALRRRPTSAGGLLSASSGRNGRRERGMAARSCAPDASAKIQVLSPVKWGRSRRGRDLWDTAAAQRRRGTHRARAPLSASLGTFSARRNHLALRRNFLNPPTAQFWYRGFHPL